VKLPFLYSNPETGQKIIFRSMRRDDFQTYKRFRLAALESKDGAFLVESGLPEKEKTDDEWRDVCSELLNGDDHSPHVAIGAFLQTEEGEILVGSALTEPWHGDETGRTAYYRAIFVHPAFRRCGNPENKGARVAETIELLQDSWAREHQFTKAVFTVHARKEAWLRRQQTVFGARLIDVDVLPYANKERAPTYYLERDLSFSPHERASAELSQSVVVPPSSRFQNSVLSCRVGS
jgi:hypothetical protein